MAAHACAEPAGLQGSSGPARAHRPRLPWHVSPRLLASVAMLASVAGLAGGDSAAAFALGGRVCPARSRAGGGASGRCALLRRGRLRDCGSSNIRMLRRSALSARSGSDEATRMELERRRLQGGLPQHLAIVMDGNRRYAKSLGFPTASVPPAPRPPRPCVPRANALALGCGSTGPRP